MFSCIRFLSQTSHLNRVLYTTRTITKDIDKFARRSFEITVLTKARLSTVLIRRKRVGETAQLVVVEMRPRAPWLTAAHRMRGDAKCDNNHWRGAYHNLHLQVNTPPPFATLAQSLNPANPSVVTTV